MFTRWLERGVRLFCSRVSVGTVARKASMRCRDRALATSVGAQNRRVAPVWSVKNLRTRDEAIDDGVCALPWSLGTGGDGCSSCYLLSRARRGRRQAHVAFLRISRREPSLARREPSLARRERWLLRERAQARVPSRLAPQAGFSRRRTNSSEWGSGAEPEKKRTRPPSIARSRPKIADGHRPP